MSDAPSLIDKTGMGGVIAIDGFDYQRWEAICRIPAWLKNAAFEGLTVEALEDFEARFFSPHAVHARQPRSALGAKTIQSALADARYAWPQTALHTNDTPPIPPAYPS